MSEVKYIKVSPETHQTLTSIGWKGESYDAIIRRLIERVYGEGTIGSVAPLRELRDIEKETED